MKYIQDIDDFDDVGKKILLPSTSTPVPRYNFQRQQLRQFRDTTAATKIQLGETIRNMKNVSPLATVRLANQTSRQISQKYFPNAGAPIQQGNSSLVLDPVLEKHDELSVDKNGYDFITYDFYLDKNHNGKMNIDTEYVFKLLLFVSTDGNKVKECYEVCQPADDEILLFLETDEDTFSERVLYGRVSESIRKTYINTTTGERYRTSSAGNLIDVALDGEILDFVKRHFSEANLEIIDDLLRKGYVEEKGIKEGFYTALKYTLLATSAPAKALGWVLDRIGSGIDYLKITDKFWDTEHPDYYFQKENLIENLSISTGKLNGLKDLFIDKPGFDLADLTPQLLDAIILNQIANVETFVDNYNRFIRTHIEKIFNDLEDPELQGQAGDIGEFIALICGIWNGLVDFVSSTFKFLGSLLEAPFDIAGDFQSAMETVDNILALLKDEKLWVNLVDAASEGMKEMVQYLKSENSEDLNWVRIHYITGFAMSFVGTFFVPGVNLAKVAEISKIGNVGSILAKINQELAEVVSKTFNLAKTQAAGGYQKIGKTIQEFLELFIKGGQKLRQFIEDLWKKIAAWFLKNKGLVQRRRFLKEIEDYISLRKEFHDEKFVEKFWKDNVTRKSLYRSNLKKLFYKYRDPYPDLLGHNFAEFKTAIKKKGRLIETVEEFSISGNKEKITRKFGYPPKLPTNTINVLDDWDDFVKFVEGVIDFKGQERRYDSEIKYIYNLLKNHMGKGDEFIIEIKNIFKTCSSCKREFVMLETYLRKKGKKVKITVFSDEIVVGTFDLKRELKIKK